MGLLRLLLALSVVFAHSFSLVSSDSFLTTALSGVGGVAAVEVFFAISGFYMAMVLGGTYSGRPRAFYANRALRIFPEYWAVALASLVMAAILGHDIIRSIFELAWPANGLLAFANAGIFGNDLVFFLTYQGGELAFGPFRQADPPLHTLLLLPQAWTLALELIFYLLAPWLVKLRSWILGVVVLVLLAVKYLVVCAALGAVDPWTYRFVGFEIAFFVIGILLFRAKVRFLSQESITRRPYAMAAIIAIIAITPFVAPRMAAFIGEPFTSLLIVLVIVIFIPRLFHETEKLKLDARMGSYSYPVYLSHLIAITLVGSVVAFLSVDLASPLVLIVIYATAMIVAFPLVKLAQLVDVLRMKVRTPAGTS